MRHLRVLNLYRGLLWFSSYNQIFFLLMSSTVESWCWSLSVNCQISLWVFPFTEFIHWELICFILDRNSFVFVTIWLFMMSEYFFLTRYMYHLIQIIVVTLPLTLFASYSPISNKYSVNNPSKMVRLSLWRYNSIIPFSRHIYSC